MQQAEREACKPGRAVTRAYIPHSQARAQTRPESVWKLTRNLRAFITRCRDLIVIPRNFYECRWKKVSALILCHSADGWRRLRVPAAAAASHAPPMTFRRKYWLGFAPWQHKFHIKATQRPHPGAQEHRAKSTRGGKCQPPQRAAYHRLLGASSKHTVTFSMCELLSNPGLSSVWHEIKPVSCFLFVCFSVAPHTEGEPSLSVWLACPSSPLSMIFGILDEVRYCAHSIEDEPQPILLKVITESNSSFLKVSFWDDDRDLSSSPEKGYFQKLLLYLISVVLFMCGETFTPAPSPPCWSLLSLFLTNPPPEKHKGTV